MTDIDDFMSKNKPTGKSKLFPYLSDILTLKQNGYSDKDVLRYLSEKKSISVGQATLTRFLKANRLNNQSKSHPLSVSKVQAISEPNHEIDNNRSDKSFEWGKTVNAADWM